LGKSAFLRISEPREELPVRQRLLHGTKFLAERFAHLVAKSFSGGEGLLQ
jgi:hypothetical protein